MGGIYSKTCAGKRSRFQPDKYKSVEDEMESGVYATTAELTASAEVEWSFWRSLACCGEDRVMAMKMNESTSADFVHLDSSEFDRFLAFVPDCVRLAINEGSLEEVDSTGQQRVAFKRCKAAVVFIDASGFTKMTEKLQKDYPDAGAEYLSEIVSDFFSLFLKVVKDYGGDVIKFSGDAITIIFPAEGTDLDPETGEPTIDTETDEKKIHAAMREVCLLACQSCIDVHKSIEGFSDPRIAGVALTLHIGIGCGDITLLQCGGVLNRYEYVLAGAPLSQISIAEPLAHSFETVISPEVHHYVKDVLEVPPDSENFEDHPDFKKILGMKQRVPIPGAQVMPEVTAHDMSIVQRFVPPFVSKRLLQRQYGYMEENRKVSVIFVCIQGLDVASVEGAATTHKLLQMVQKRIYSQEGTVNKLLVDDKGVLLLAVFGLPPMAHIDDPVRAVHAAVRIIDALKELSINGMVGVTTGEVWCGVVGAPHRREYTVLGDSVNLSARLMGNSKTEDPDKLQLLICEETYKAVKNQFECEVLNPIMVKGKSQPIPVFRPTGKKFTREPNTKLIQDMPIASWDQWPVRQMLESILGGYLADEATFKKEIALKKEEIEYNISQGEIDDYINSEGDIGGGDIDPVTMAIYEQYGMLALGGVMCAISEREQAAAGAVFRSLVESQRINDKPILFCEGANNGNYKLVETINDKQLLTCVAWKQIFGKIFKVLKDEDLKETNTERSPVDVLRSALPVKLRIAVDEKLHELSTFIQDLEDYLAKNQTSTGGAAKMTKTRARSRALEKMESAEDDLVDASEMTGDNQGSGIDRVVLLILERMVERALEVQPICIQLYIRKGTWIIPYLDEKSWELATVFATMAMRRRSYRASFLGCVYDGDEEVLGEGKGYEHLRGGMYPLIFSLVAPEERKLKDRSQQAAHKPLFKIFDYAQTSATFVEVKELDNLAKLAFYLAHSFDVPPPVISQNNAFHAEEYHEIPKPVLDLVMAHSSGDPTHADDTIAHLLNSGYIEKVKCTQVEVGRPGKYRFIIPADKVSCFSETGRKEIPLAETVFTASTRKLDSFAPDEQAVIKTACAMPDEHFDALEIAAMLSQGHRGMTPLDVQKVFVSLKKANVIQKAVITRPDRSTAIQRRPLLAGEVNPEWELERERHINAYRKEKKASAFGPLSDDLEADELKVAELSFRYKRESDAPVDQWTFSHYADKMVCLSTVLQRQKETVREKSSVRKSASVVSGTAEFDRIARIVSETPINNGNDHVEFDEDMEE